MNLDARAATLTSAVILVGGHQLPLAVLLGALVGASLFMLNADGYSSSKKTVLFGVSLLAGLFIADDINPLLNAFLPIATPLELGQFLCAAIAAFFTEIVLKQVSHRIDAARLKKGLKK